MRELVAAGAEVYGLRVLSSTLEDAYLEAVGRAPGTGNEADGRAPGEATAPGAGNEVGARAGDRLPDRPSEAAR